MDVFWIVRVFELSEKERRRRERRGGREGEEREIRRGGGRGDARKKIYFNLFLFKLFFVFLNFLHFFSTTRIQTTTVLNLQKQSLLPRRRPRVEVEARSR